MKSWLMMLLIVSLMSSLVYAEAYSVEKVIDGNTLRLTNGETVRLLGVDAPDVGSSKNMGLEAKRALEGLLRSAKKHQKFSDVNLVYDGKIRAENDKSQAYAYVETFCSASLYTSIAVHGRPTQHIRAHPVKIFVNKAMIEMGYAYPKSLISDAQTVAIFQELHKEAIRNRKGLWKNKSGEACQDDAECFCMGNPDVMDGCGKPEQVWRCLAGKCQLTFEQIMEG